MSKKRSSNKRPGDAVLVALELDPAEWTLAIDYSKGFLSGSRYTRVSVRHLQSGRERTASFYATGKAAARRDAIAEARRLVQELRGK